MKHHSFINVFKAFVENETCFLRCKGDQPRGLVVGASDY